MEWKEKISLIEKDGNWQVALRLFEEDKKEEVDFYLRIIFILLDFLVDRRYTQEEHDFVAPKVEYIFNEANLKYSDNAEFLFFSGIMISIAEWYFGMATVEPAMAMLKRSMQREPENLLYKWGYYSLPDQRLEVNSELKFQLAEHVLRDEVTINLLNTKGLLGQYVLGIVEYFYQGLYKDFK